MEHETVIRIAAILSSLIGLGSLAHYKPTNPTHAMSMKLWERLVFSGTFIAVAVTSRALLFELI